MRRLWERLVDRVKPSGPNVSLGPLSVYTRHTKPLVPRVIQGLMSASAPAQVVARVQAMFSDRNWRVAVEKVQVAFAYGVSVQRQLYNHALKLCAGEGRIDEAEGVYKIMRKTKTEADDVTHHSLFSAAVNSGDWMHALRFMHELKTQKLRVPNEDVVRVMGLCSEAGKWYLCRGFFDDVLEDGDAENELKQSGYKHLLKGCAVCRDPIAALSVFKEMEENSFQADSESFGYLLQALAAQGHWNYCLSVLEEMKDRQIPVGSAHTIPLMESLAAAGKVDHCLNVFVADMDAMTSSSEALNALARSCVQTGAWEICWFTLSLMAEAGIAPDSTAYLNLLKSLSVAGKYQEALVAVLVMKEQNVSLNQDHLDVLMELFSSKREFAIKVMNWMSVSGVLLNKKAYQVVVGTGEMKSQISAPAPS